MTFITILVVLCIAIIGIVLLPSVKQFYSMRQYIGTTQEYLEQQYTEGKTISKSLQHINNITQDTKTYDHALLKQGHELELITRMESIANGRIEQNLSVNYKERGTEKPTRKKDDMPQKKRLDRSYYVFSFVNKGRYEDLIQYMHELEQLPEYLIIDTIRWEREPKATTTTPTTILRFDARIYEKNP